MKTVKILFITLITLLLISSAYAGDTTRITFLHSEGSSWSDTRETEGYIVEWNVTTATVVSFPVDVEAYNNGSILPSGTDQVCFKLQTPEGEGVVNITVSGYLNVTIKGIIPITGYTEFQNTTLISATTPLGEWETSYPLPVPVPVGALVIIVTVTPTLYVNASVQADVSLTGPAIAFTPSLTWETNNHVENVTVTSVSAEKGDEITVSTENFSYEWNASLTTDLSLEGTHLVTSPTYWFKTPSLETDESVTVSFDITVIPEFSTAALIFSLLAVSTIAVFTKRKLKA